VETDLQNLISEYCAIEKMDRLLLSTDRADETELIGLRVREMRRREILVELTTWIIAAEDFGESTSLSVRVSAILERNGFNPIETRKVQHENWR
jgi:hypothetical protein